MFRKDVAKLDGIVIKCLRENGLETPLQQHRLINSWGNVAGSLVERYTQEKFIRNQVLFVKILNPALRTELSMRKTEYVNRLNAIVGTRLITDIRFY